jgi:hypothetical protein
MYVADPAIDQLYDAIVTVPPPPEYMPRSRQNVPRPLWQRAAVITIRAVFLVAYAGAFAICLFDLLTHDFVPEGNYFALTYITSQIFVYAVFS